MYSDYANREAERLDTYYKGDFWSVTPVQTVATHASIVFPNYSAIMGLFDGKYRTVSQPEKIVGAQCAVDIASSAEFFIGSLVAKNIATRLVSTTPKPTRKLKPAELETLISKADWLGHVPASEQPVFKKLVLNQPKFEFDDDFAVMMAATSAHVPLMMGLVAAALALLALIPWRPKLKYPYISPIVIGAAGLPLSLMLDSHRVAIWAQNNSLSTMFVDFNTAQKFMSNLGYATIGLAIIIAAYRLIANWKNQEVRVQTGIGLAVLLVSLAPTQLQFSLVLVGALLATLDSEKLIQPGVAVFICTAAIGLEYSFQPQGMQALLGVVPAVLAVAAAPRLRGATQLGWLSLALIFSGFLVQRITLPSMGTWYEKERDQLANYRKEIGVAVIR
ncbi:MAG TPA: hypothetical protein VK171_00675, partial [Fimbriimonas sp.]|nr:hypothetical protein [Fimbriimonas sp.]